MTGYTKLFSSITDSTIWQAPDAHRLVWITMLALADQNGYVAASIPGLASRARVSLEDCIAALESFQQPDKWSRTKDFEGRRIAEADGGWILLNHSKYREIRDREERREQARLAMARLRASRKETVNDVSHGYPPLAQAEASTEASTKAKKEEKTSVAPAPDTKEIWRAYETSYELRYGTKPTRNAKVNGQMTQFARRLSSDEAPLVAAFFVVHQNAYYVQRGHAVDCLLRDAEKLRTEWATGNQINGHTARQQERTAANPFVQLALEGQRKEAISGK